MEPQRSNDLALVFSGGGARAAYQVGFLRCLAHHYPDLHICILTGVSAGAINAAYLANHRGTFPEAVDELYDFWRDLTMDQVFLIDNWHLLKNIFHWGTGLISGDMPLGSTLRGLMDTTPLRKLLNSKLKPEAGQLTGVQENLQRGRLKAFAITSTNYATGQTVTWVQGRDIELWERPSRRSIRTTITIDHIMSSAALPLFFPAVEVGNAWYGDGGIRQSAPLSPALHLGARRILAISTRYARTMEQANIPVVSGYPPPAQIMGTLMNAIFLDALDQDAHSLDQINLLLDRIPDHKPGDMHAVDHFVMRPSEDLGTLAGTFEADLPYMFRFLTRGLGTHKTTSPDWLSMVMFDTHYINRLMDVGEADAYRHRDAIAALLDR
ncbi:MAG: patatin-like phospholipase family protein [Desulfobacterales bacterium]